VASELLSVCIPTRNRAVYLRDLLTAFAGQVQADRLGPEDVAFYISDNAAVDNTPDVVREFQSKVPGATYSRNPADIGAGPNIIKVRGMARGKYHWVVGDDELLCDRALVNLLKLLRQHEGIGLVIAYNSNYDLKVPAPQVFADYRAYARECIRYNVHALAEHSLISSNIFRGDCYDAAFAEEKLGTFFPHMFGMLRPLLKLKAGVALPGFPIITIRKHPAAPVDAVWIDLDAYWISYFKWLQEEMQMPEFDPYAPSECARRNLRNKMLRNPLKFVWNNRKSIFNPMAYRFVFDRLFRKRR
jgi:glycosyltransferase involved in cell wall biosynthesis